MINIQEIEYEIINLKQLVRLLSSPAFTIAYNHAIDDVKSVIERKIKERDYGFLSRWTDKQRDISEYTMRELRLLAKSCKVYNYCYLSKEALLVEIANARRNRKITQ